MSIGIFYTGGIKLSKSVSMNSLIQTLIYISQNKGCTIDDIYKHLSMEREGVSKKTAERYIDVLVNNNIVSKGELKRNNQGLIQSKEVLLHDDFIRQIKEY